ncbi:MAG: efflux RND transporter permease subunit [Thiotrichales bacterium]
MLKRLFENHVLANLTFVLVLLIGALSYWQLPREQDPTINFNWIDISTIVPGMAAEDMEKRVTDVLEDAIRGVSDIKFVSSTSRESISTILVRFNDISERVFDKRVNDLRREIQNKERELPAGAESPFIFEVTTANAFPTATIVVAGPADDENLRKQAELIEKDLGRIKGVDRILGTAVHNPELQVNFDPAALEQLGLSPTALADTVALYYRDLSAGTTEVGAVNWVVRVAGSQPDPIYLADLPVIGAEGEIRLGDVAQVIRSRARPQQLVHFEGQPAVMLAVTKQASSNTLKLVENLQRYVDERNQFRAGTGVRLVVADDQTEITRNALRIMQTNALYGLLLVLLVTWAFLGFRMAALVSIGIPFILAGTFWVLDTLGQTLNVSVLLGVVISLGMLVDDTVVIAEGIFYRLQRGWERMQAALDTLHEIASPVTASVLTTMAAFLPLMLLPGILGKFMLVIPLVVTIALAISLIEAFWMLPIHVVSARVGFDRPSRIHRLRTRWLHLLRVRYTRLLIRAMRWPRLLLGGFFMLFAFALASAVAGQVNPALFNDPVFKRLLVKTDFFASDPLRLYYVNLEMPNGTPLEATLAKAVEIEAVVRRHLEPGELRSIVTYSGQMFTEAARFQGSHYGQLLVALNPRHDEMREVDAVIDSMRADVTAVLGPAKTWFLRIAGGPPTSKPINIKVRGSELDEIRAATAALKTLLADSGWASDVSDDDSPGLNEMVLQLDSDAVRRAGLNPQGVLRSIQLWVDGEIITAVQHEGEKIEVRVRARPERHTGVGDLLGRRVPLAGGGSVPLGELVRATNQPGLGNVRHYNFRRAITVEADIDKAQTDTVTANRFIQKQWQALGTRFPNVQLDFSGELDDINESLGAIGKLMLFGVLLMYAIVGTQFRSYVQPLMILITVPMAFTGVVIGLLVTANPLSLFTLYGVVALTGIAVNAAIVLIHSANSRLGTGMSVLHAILYAARRRVIPILITATTTIAGLFALATGLGGKSLLWGPVATAIVWGLAVSTVLTLFIVPILYRLFMPRSYLNPRRPPRRAWWKRAAPDLTTAQP